MNESKGDESLARSKRGFTVGASPFNMVKLELALILVGAVLVLLINGRVSDDAAVQWAMVVGYGLLAMLWLMFRTRRVLQQQVRAHGSAEKAHGEKE